MTFLKNGFYLLFACSILVLTSCGDDDCTAPIIDENIVGSWEESFSGDIVEFKADGTLIDENQALLGVGDESTSTYVIVGNTFTEVRCRVIRWRLCGLALLALRLSAIPSRPQGGYASLILLPPLDSSAPRPC